MQSLKEKQGSDWKPLKGTRNDIPYMKKDHCGLWSEELDKEIAVKIRHVWSM